MASNTFYNDQIYMNMRKRLYFMMITCCMVITFFCLGSCDSNLDIQQEYPFTVESMPVVDKIQNGETVEIRLEIKEKGTFAGMLYTLRYFQPDGSGLLKTEDGTLLNPNDRYLVSEKKFRLYYTSQSANEAQTIDLYFENNWGGLSSLSFSFNSRDKDEGVTMGRTADVY